MYKKIKEIADKAELPYQIEYGDHYQRFVELVVDELAKAVEETGKQCAYTTHDLGVVNCTIAKCIEVVKTHFKEQT
jgi:hypothetical protein